ncbi:unnamed protein product [Brassica oleracea]
MSFSVWIWLFLGKNDVDVSMYQDCTLVEPKWCLNVSVRVWVLQRNHTRSAMVMGCCFRMKHTCIIVAQNNIVLEWFMYLSVCKFSELSR